MNKILGAVIFGFITILIGVSLLTTLAGNIFYTNNLATVTAAQVTFTNNTCNAVTTTDCIYSITNIKNATTGAVLGVGNYSICQASRGQNNGVFLDLENSAFTGGMGNITYQVDQQCMYVADNTSRTIIGLIVLFFAIAIMIGGFYWLKESDIFDWF